MNERCASSRAVLALVLLAPMLALVLAPAQRASL
jgi:hypothetical protein